jgi:RNA polymerase sigma factor (TIGR02999 family)
MRERKNRANRSIEKGRPRRFSPARFAGGHRTTLRAESVSDGGNRAEGQELGHGGDLLPLVYDELRKLAAQKLAHERPGQTLQATDLVHEAYARLEGGEKGRPWNNPGHFFAAAAEAMRRILIERALRKQRIRHGGGRQRVSLDALDVGAEADEDLLVLNEALNLLAQEEPRSAQVFALRYFTGLTIEETAVALGAAVRTVNRDWAFAKAWLHLRLSEERRSDG